MAMRSDVCLILEGTYPYISGGVSSWVHQLVTNMSNIRFSLLVILPSEEYGREMRYTLPRNVMELSHVLIHNYEVPSYQKTKGNKAAGYTVVRDFMTGALVQDFSRFGDLVNVLSGDPPLITPHDLLFSQEAWTILCDFYRLGQLQQSFLDIFWTYRFTLLPFLRVVNGRIPKAKVYHTIATGYAGVIGACAVIQNPDSALILTEHGIYAKERRIEIADATWVYDEFDQVQRPDHASSFFKDWWIYLFQMFSKVTYQYADQIITLYEGNRQAQIADGAAPEKCMVIPNGLNLKKYQTKKVRQLPSKKERLVVSLVGRVVPIKDIKTFIYAAKIICDALPNADCWVCGPFDEDRQYYDDCLILRDLLGLEDRLIFKGKLNLLDWYPEMDVMVLTSVSEGMPLVILEAWCYGMPCVATDVGSCGELLNGSTIEDKELGAAGLITHVSNPPETAEAVMKILKDDELFASMGKAGTARLQRYYQEDDLFARYYNIYESYL